MNCLKSAAVAFAAACAFAAPAFAGECPTDQVGANTLEGAPTAPTRVTDTVIASIDLGNGYALPGRTLRMRKLIVEPGGVVPLHSHAERPANIFVVQGAITEYNTRCRVGIEHRAGDVTAESGQLSHWWRNNTHRRAVLISSDIPPAEGNAQGGM